MTIHAPDGSAGASPSDLSWPISDAFRVSRVALAASTNKSGFNGFYSGDRQEISHLSDRLTMALDLPSCTRVQAAERSALLAHLESTGAKVRRGAQDNNGTLRGTPTLAATVAPASRSISLVNARAGRNLLRLADALEFFGGGGWSAANATVTENAATDPEGGSTAWSISRTATGNHFVSRLYTLATTEYRSVTFSIWLKAGTLTGNVVLRIRDGGGLAEFGSATVTPTASWAVYRVSAVFDAGSAPNVSLFIDPANDTGSAGDSLLGWVSEIRLHASIDTLCKPTADAAAAPAGLLGFAETVTRTGAGNAYSAFILSTTAHALQTYTFSIYLRAGTFSGTVSLFMRDGAGTQVGSATVTPTGTWQRFSVTGTFGAAPAPNVICFVDQSDAGAVNETFERYGAQLEYGSDVTDYSPYPVAAAGDLVSLGGNLLMVGPAGATGDYTGAITLPLALPLQRAATAGAVVECSAPTGLWRLDTDGIETDLGPQAVQGGVSLRFRQEIA